MMRSGDTFGADKRTQLALKLVVLLTVAPAPVCGVVVLTFGVRILFDVVYLMLLSWPVSGVMGLVIYARLKDREPAKRMRIIALLAVVLSYAQLAGVAAYAYIAAN